MSLAWSIVSIFTDFWRNLLIWLRIILRITERDPDVFVWLLTLSWKGRVTDVSEKSTASILRVEVRRKEDSYFAVHWNFWQRPSYNTNELEDWSVTTSERRRRRQHGHIVPTVPERTRKVREESQQAGRESKSPLPKNGWEITAVPVTFILYYFFNLW
jgi:hypothetical protein